MDLSIIIVNYKTPDLTIQCIESVEKETRSIDYEIIVVDNNSEDDSQSRITNRFPKVKWIQSHYNEGFGRANNIAISSATSDYLLLLNSDVIVIENTIERSLSFFKEKSSNEKIGCLGCRLLNEDLSYQTSVFEREELPTLSNQLRANILLRKILPESSAKPLHKFEKPGGYYYIDYISGAFFLTTKQMMKETGGFDPEYFMYFEEMDLCGKAISKGFRNIFYNEAAIIHLGGRSSNLKINPQLYQSAGLFLAKQHSALYLLSYSIIFLFNTLTYRLIFPFISEANKGRVKDMICMRSSILPEYFRISADMLFGGRVRQSPLRYRKKPVL